MYNATKIIQAVLFIAKPTLRPRITIAITPTMPMIVAGRVLRPHLFVRIPYTTASKIKSTEIIAVVWFGVGFVVKPNFTLSAEKNVPATTFTNEAITRMSTRRAKMMKSFFHCRQ